MLSVLLEASSTVRFSGDMEMCLLFFGHATGSALHERSNSVCYSGAMLRFLSSVKIKVCHLLGKFKCSFLSNEDTLFMSSYSYFDASAQPSNRVIASRQCLV